MQDATQTSTAVHDMQAMITQRNAALVRDENALSSLSMFAQMMIGGAVYLFDHVATPGYMAALLSGIPLMLLYLGVRASVLRCDSAKGPLLSTLGPGLAKAAAVSLALALFLDAQLAMLALAELVNIILPTTSLWWTALVFALFTSFGIGNGGRFALPRVARFIRMLLVLVLIFCGVRSVPYGDAGHLFPLLGEGVPSILRGALWMTGCVATAAIAPLTPHDKPAYDLMRTGRPNRYRSLLISMGVAVGLLCLFSYLLTYFAYTRQEPIGWRLLLLSQFLPSTVDWSLLVTGELFILLIALAAGASRASRLIGFAAGKNKSPGAMLLIILLFTVPAAATRGENTMDFLINLAPWRFVLVALPVLGAVIAPALKGGNRQ